MSFCLCNVLGTQYHIYLRENCLKYFCYINILYNFIQRFFFWVWQHCPKILIPTLNTPLIFSHIDQIYIEWKRAYTQFYNNFWDYAFHFWNTNTSRFVIFIFLYSFHSKFKAMGVELEFICVFCFLYNENRNMAQFCFRNSVPTA